MVATALLTAAAALAAGNGFPASERAALNLAIAGTRDAPPDLYALIVRHRMEFLGGVRETVSRTPAADFSREARALSRSIVERAHFPEVIRRCGAIVGELIAFETPKLATAAERREFEEASAGPYSFSGVSPAAAAGDPGPLASSIASAAADPGDRKPGARAVVDRIVTHETNLLWAVWIGAGGDRRPAKKLEEKNGPYGIAGAPR